MCTSDAPRSTAWRSNWSRSNTCGLPAPVDSGCAAPRGRLRLRLPRRRVLDRQNERPSGGSGPVDSPRSGRGVQVTGRVDDRVPGPPAVAGSGPYRDPEQGGDGRRDRRAQGVEVVAALEEHDGAARGTELEDARGEGGVVAGRQREPGERVGAVRVVTRPRRAPRSARTVPRAARPCRARPGTRRPSRPPAAGSSPSCPGPGPRRDRRAGRFPDRAATRASTRRTRSGRPRTCPGCRCRGARPSRRSAPVRRGRAAPRRSPRRCSAGRIPSLAREPRGGPAGRTAQNAASPSPRSRASTAASPAPAA